MNDLRVFVAGLPNAGKTTFLAALWHLIRSDEVETMLRFDGLAGINVGYLNKIRDLWLEAKPVGRTRPADEGNAEINLRSATDQLLRLTIPDFAGEAFSRAWEDRGLPAHVVEAAKNSQAQLLMINVDQIVQPRTVDEYRNELEQSGLPAGEELPFLPAKCPTAAILADVIGMLESRPFSVRPAKIGIALTAWDAIDAEGSTPEQVLKDELPLIAQMMQTREADQDIRVFGVSAQGGSYGTENDAVLIHEEASQRIVLVDGEYRGPDLTRMLSWLLT